MEQQHAIGKLSLEVQLPSREEAFALQGTLSTRCNTELVPLLAELLDSWTDADTLLQIDKLEIDLGSCNMEALRKELPDMVITYLRKHYQSLQSQSTLEEGMQRVPLIQGYFESWLYFLKHGILPPSAVKWQQDEWEAGILAALSSETTALQQCHLLFMEHPYAVKRLVLQFSTGFVHNWILAYSADAYRQVLQVLTEWEAFVYHPQLAEMIKAQTPLQQLTIPPAPERTVYQDSVIMWLVREIIIPGHTITNAALLEQLIQRLSSRKDAIASWLLILQKTFTTPVKAPVALHEAATVLAVTHAAEISMLQRDIHPERPRVKPDAEQSADEKGTRPSGEQHPVDKRNTEQSEEEAMLRQHKAGEERKKGEPAANDLPAKGNDKESGVAKMQTDNEQQSSIAAADKTGSDEDIEPPGPPAEGTVYYINNAGLILLHPYLSYCFDALGLREGQQFKDEAASHKAVQLLGYLAYGEEDIPEYELVLPKLLCGILPAEPVRRFIPLSDADKAEANELLTSVIGHWNALGNTSPDGLRGNFLLREGKLEWKEEEWQLYVTQQSYDMLLNRLPWGFSVVGLSWMPWLIKTVWI